MKTRTASPSVLQIYCARKHRSRQRAADCRDPILIRTRLDSFNKGDVFKKKADCRDFQWWSIIGQSWWKSECFQLETGVGAVDQGVCISSSLHYSAGPRAHLSVKRSGSEVLLSRSGMSEQTGRLCPGPWLGLCPLRPTGGRAICPPAEPGPARPGPLHWFPTLRERVPHTPVCARLQPIQAAKKKQMDEPNKLQLLIAVHMSVSHQTHFPACLVSTTSKWQTVCDNVYWYQE